MPPSVGWTALTVAAPADSVTYGSCAWIEAQDLAERRADVLRLVALDVVAADTAAVAHCDVQKAVRPEGRAPTVVDVAQEVVANGETLAPGMGNRL